MLSFLSQPKDPTVADILGTAVMSDKHIGSSGVRSAYALGSDDVANAPYVLRVEKPMKPKHFKHKLMRTTSMHAPEKLATGMAIGQPLLVSHPKSPWEFSIHRRETGQSIEQMMKGMDKNAYGELGMKVMQPLLKRGETGDNPFQPMLDDCYHLLREGYNPDLQWANVLVDSTRGTITMVDQYDMKITPQDHDGAMVHMRDVVRRLHQEVTNERRTKQHRHTHPAPDGYDICVARIDRLLDNALRSVEARNAPGAPTFPRFQKVRQHQVALSGKPGELWNTLRPLYEQASPRR